MKIARLILLLALTPSALLAATKTWTGAALDGKWSSVSNWDDSTTPVTGDILVFNGESSPSSIFETNDLPAGTVLHSLKFNSGSFCVRLSGNALALTNGMASPLCQTTFQIPISLEASQTWSGGLVLFQPVDLGPHTLTASGPAFSAPIHGTGGLIVSGTVNFQTSVDYAGSTVITAGGTLRCACVIENDVTVAGGALEFGPPSGQPQTGPLTVSGGVLRFIRWRASSNDVSLDSSSKFIVTKDQFGPAQTLTVTGSVALGNAQLDFSSPTYTPPTGTVYTLVSNDGADPVSGTFAGLPEGAVINGSNFTARISYHGGDGNDVTLTIVDLAATSTSLDVRPNPTHEGGMTTLTAQVTSSGGTPNGSVTFYDGAAPIASQPLSGGSAVAVVGPLARGSHSISATYVPGNNPFLGSTSPTVSLAVDVATITATTTALDVTPERSTRGQPVTLTATVTSSSGVPFGNVVFADGDTLLESVPVSGGGATITTSALDVGEHTLRAAFVPMGSAFAPSTSAAVAHTVVEARRRAAKH
ncbi:MAG TPA: Ig-like domain-containing protein [Thermoanaerobaculia bacterium]|nr:Ig-like domain-containing protein [Thermoanaerobaculia bacterium]